jgi:hypothetical protein
MSCELEDYQASIQREMAAKRLRWGKEPAWRTFRTNVDGVTVQRLVGRLQDAHGNSSFIDEPEEAAFYQAAIATARNWSRQPSPSQY